LEELVHPGSFLREDLRQPKGAPQIPPLRSFGAPAGMTKGKEVTFQQVGDWMDGVSSG